MIARSSQLLASLVGLGVLAGFPAVLSGQVPVPTPVRPLTGQVIDAGTGEPVVGVRVELGGGREAAQTNRAGEFSFPDVQGDSVTLRAWRLGYASLDTTVVVSGLLRVTVALEPLPIALAPLIGRARANPGGAARERALFDREVTPGVVGISGAELRDLPAAGEADVLRSLQVVPGVVFLNDLSARLHVRGGGPDENLFLLDGARIFAPYHMFSMMGAFNADAVARAELYRGSLPARFGGALSSVIDLEQQDGTIGGRAYDGGLSLLGVRMMARDILPAANASWMLAFRRTHLDLIADNLLGKDFPYAFHDVNARFTIQPRSNQRVRASFFTSSDRFRFSFGGGTGDRMASSWRNVAGSVRWERTGPDRWGVVAGAWGSRYDASLLVGASSGGLTTDNAVGVAGLRLEATRRGRTASLRAGLDMEAGNVALLGGDNEGGYVDGDTRDTFVLPAAYVEAEAWLGRLRVAPGLRATLLSHGSPVLAPRLAGRLHLNDDLALTAGWGWSYQSLSTVRDDRYPLPGAPFWFLHPPSHPASRADVASVGFEGWVDETWSFSLGAYAREFSDVPRWRPVGARDLSQVVFDAGHAEGVEIMLRRHVAPVTGWIGYGYGRVRATESDTERRYSPTWDRRHSLNVGMFGDINPALRISGRLAYGSGVPYWPVIGENDGLRFDPLQGTIELGDHYPVWATEQIRLPSYTRLDLAVSYRFRWLGAELEPHLDLLNLLGRPNVLYYELRSDEAGLPGGNQAAEPRLHPVVMPSLALPGIGVRVRF
jgi:hypothetical protein